jgi:hypothetical protein
MAFLGDSGDDILVTERNNGNVKLVIDREVQDEPLIDVEVANNNGPMREACTGWQSLMQQMRQQPPPPIQQKQPPLTFFCTLLNQVEEKIAMMIKEWCQQATGYTGTTS